MELKSVWCLFGEERGNGEQNYVQIAFRDLEEFMQVWFTPPPSTIYFNSHGRQKFQGQCLFSKACLLLFSTNYNWNGCTFCISTLRIRTHGFSDALLKQHHNTSMMMHFNYIWLIENTRYRIKWYDLGFPEMDVTLVSRWCHKSRFLVILCSYSKVTQPLIFFVLMPKYPLLPAGMG